MGIYPRPSHSLCRCTAVRPYAAVLAPPSRERLGARSAHHQRNCLARTEDISAVRACRARSPLAAPQLRRGKRVCASPPAQGSYRSWPQTSRDGNQTSISKTPWGRKVFKNSTVLSKSNFLSRALTTRKKRSFEASANLATLKIGWHGVGSPFMASMPKTAQRAAPRMVSSNVIGIQNGQLLYGLLAIFSGKLITFA